MVNEHKKFQNTTLAYTTAAHGTYSSETTELDVFMRDVPN
jgi:hypothetical protein